MNTDCRHNTACATTTGNSSGASDSNCTSGNACTASAVKSADATPQTSTGRFNQRADSYSRHASIQRDMAAWLAQWLPAAQSDGINTFPDNCPHTHALDLGAGDGTFTRYLANHFSNVTALDCAAQMLAKGRSNLPHVRWLHGEAWTLQPLCQEELYATDFITSSSLLQWCRTPQATLRQWAERTRSGTRMLHGFYIEPTLREWRTLFGTPPSPDWLTAAQWQDAFAAAGWRVLRSEYETRYYRFSNALQLARSLHGTGAIANTGQLGSGRFRALLREYDALYAIENLPTGTPHYNFADARPTQAGSVFASWAFFRIEAERL